MRSQLVTCLVCLLGVNFSAAQADLVVSWDLTGNGGAPPTQPASATATHVTGLDIIRGTGLITHQILNTVSATGWDSSDADDYLSLGFTVAPGFQVDLEKFLVMTRSTLSGPGTLGLYYSIDNFSTSLHTFDQRGGKEVFSAVDLSSLTGLTGTVEFRIIEIGNTSHDGTTATAAGGVLRMVNYDGTNGSIRFEGTVLAAVPEPSAFLCGGLIACVLGLNYARQRLQAQNASACRTILPHSLSRRR